MCEVSQELKKAVEPVVGIEEIKCTWKRVVYGES